VAAGTRRCRLETETTELAPPDSPKPTQVLGAASTEQWGNAMKLAVAGLGARLFRHGRRGRGLKFERSKLRLRWPKGRHEAQPTGRLGVDWSG
jgi:hypothetical protein